MWSRQNVSFHSATTAVCAGIDIDNGQGAARSILITAGLISLSILSGWICRNERRWKDTLIAVGVLSIIHREAISAAIAKFVPNQSYVYVMAVVFLQVSVASRIASAPSPNDEDVRSDINDVFLPPLIFPCRTKHTRFFPTKHSFQYSYLYVGIPINGPQRAGSLLSTELSQTKTWFSVHSDDYLARGSDAGGLGSNLKAYLASQNVSQEEYPYAYLVTAPRFLGFSFNPVSFWYLYDQQKKFAAMILEVNNTFDERRMYFMRNKSSTASVAQNFTNDWAKDFHVSPFNDREGSYHLSAKNPWDLREDIRIDNNIVLRSEDGKAKIVAHVFSTEAALEPTKISWLQSGLFVARWWWVGFMTNPRILREARMLWVKKLQVFYRPEVFTTSIARKDTAEEAVLESLFRDYLQRLINISSSHTSLEYIPAAGCDRDKLVYLGQQSRTTNDVRSLRVKILTPAFYTELVKFSVVKDAFESYCFNPAQGTKMVEISDVSTFRSFLEQDSVALNQGTAIPPSKGPDHVFRRIRCLVKLRFQKDESKDMMASMFNFDTFIRHQHPSRYPRYSKIAIRALLADAFAFGFTPLLDLYALIVWSALGLAATGSATSLIQREWEVSTGLQFIFALILMHSCRAIWADHDTKR